MRDKKITVAASILLVAINVGLFLFVWRLYYNAYAFRAHRAEGLIGATVVYYALYRWLSRLYRGYAFASTSIGDTVLSQFISFGLADLLMYAACCLLRRQYVNILPGTVIVAWQLAGSTLVIWLAKKLLYRFIQPAQTLLIYGGAENPARAKRFIGRIRSRYGHLFFFPTVVHEARTEDVLCAIGRAEAVMCMNVSLEKRALYENACMSAGQTFYYVPEFVDIVSRGSAVKHFLDTPLMRYEPVPVQGNGLVKRAIDIAFSLVCLIAFSPFMLLTALCVKLEDGGPVFYRQERLTQNGRSFRIIKFRSMTQDAEADGIHPATRADARVTRVGRIIRRIRLDETPQLFNVLRGDMSIVGPRPERVEHYEIYERELPEFRYRLRVRAGLTGYAQVYGKYNTAPEDKLLLDLLYIEEQSLLLDFKLVLLTLKTLFQPERSEGFSAVASARMSEGAKPKEDAR